MRQNQRGQGHVCNYLYYVIPFYSVVYIMSNPKQSRLLEMPHALTMGQRVFDILRYWKPHFTLLQELYS